MNWLRGSLAVAGLAVAGCRTTPQGAVRIDPVLESLVPADTLALAGLRMEALRATPVYQKWAASKAALPLEGLAKETGVDLRKDVSEALLASNGKESLVLARGKFSRSQLESNLTQRGAGRERYEGYTLIGDDEAALVVLDSTTIVAGRPAMVRAALQRRSRSGGAPRALLEEIRKITGDNQMWGVSLGGFEQVSQAVPLPGNLANLARIAGLIEKSTFAADLRSGLSASASMLCRTEQDAKTLSDALRGLIGLARLSTPDSEPDLLRLYDGIQVSLEQRTVKVRAQIPQELLDKAVARFSSGLPAFTFQPGFPGLRLP